MNAQKWANHLAAIDQLQHDPSSTDGENLFYMYGGDPAQACDRAVNNWYQEIRNYDFKSPHLDDSTSKSSDLNEMKIINYLNTIIIIIIHQTHSEKSDWSRAFNQFTIACELDMINVWYLLQIIHLSCQVQRLPGY